jgi:hypothetical protein
VANRGRPCFHRPDGTKAAANCGAPIALVAYGEDNARILAGCGLGVCVHWSNAALTGGEAVLSNGVVGGSNDA